MKNKWLLPLLSLAAIGTFSSGCYSTLDGHVKAGSPFGRDTLESRYERPAAQVFSAAKAVLAFNGTLNGENTISNTLWAKVDTRSVYVKVEELEPRLSKVQVQARRKGGGNDIDLASEIDKQIALRLTQQP